MIKHTSAVLGSLLFLAFAATAADVDGDKRDPAVREEQAARQEAKQGRLENNADREQREQNKYARCDYLQGDDRAYCIRRMDGEGTVSGSVEGGGIVRELRVNVPAK